MSFSHLASAVDSDPDLAIEIDDQNFADFRLGYGNAPGPDHYTYHFDPYAGPPVIEIQDRFNAADLATYSIGLVGGSKAAFGWTAGIEGVYARGRPDLKQRQMNGAIVALNTPPSLLWRSTGGNAMAGVEVSFGRRVHLEVLGVIGGGRIRFDALNGAQDHVGLASGWYWDSGARAGLYVRYRRTVLGLVAGYTSYRSPSAFCGWANGTTVYDKASWSGAEGRIEIGYQLQ